MFDMERRLEVNLQDLDFKILHMLMALAEDTDHEIVMKRSAKAQSSFQDLAKKLRL